MSVQNHKAAMHPRPANIPLRNTQVALNFEYEDDVYVINVGMDESTTSISSHFTDYCQHLRDRNMTPDEDRIFIKGHVVLFTAFLFDRKDVRNIYFALDQHRNFRLPTWKSLLGAADLQAAEQPGKPMVIRIKVEISDPTRAELQKLIKTEPTCFRAWGSEPDMRIARGREVTPPIEDNTVLSIDVPVTGQSSASLYQGAAERKKEIDTLKLQLYNREVRPMLTLQPYQPVQGITPSSFEGPFQLSVRLINQLQLPDLVGVYLPAHAWIEVVPPRVPASRITKALSYALRQKYKELDAGKEKADLSRGGRLFEGQNVKKWRIELWFMPQGRDQEYFYRYEGANLAEFCSPGWDGLHVEAHFVPSDAHYTKQSDLLAGISPGHSTNGGSESRGKLSNERPPHVASGTLASSTLDRTEGLVDLYGYSADAATIKTTRIHQQLTPGRLDWPSKHIPHFLHLDLVRPENGPQLPDNGPSTTDTRTSILRGILNKRHRVKDYNNDEPKWPNTEHRGEKLTEQTAVVYHIGVNIINSLHAVGLDDVEIPPILISTTRPASFTTSSIIRQILEMLESQNVQDPEIALGRLFTMDAKQQWHVQLWYLPRGNSTVMALPGDTTWDRFLDEDDDRLYVEAHVISIAGDGGEQAIATQETKIDKGKGRAAVVDLSEEADDTDTGGERVHGTGQVATPEMFFFKGSPQVNKEPTSEDVDELDRGMAAVALVEMHGRADDQELLAQQRLFEEMFQAPSIEGRSYADHQSQHSSELAESSRDAERRRGHEDQREARKVIDEALDHEVDEALGRNSMLEEDEIEDWEDEVEDWEDEDDSSDGADREGADEDGDV